MNSIADSEVGLNSAVARGVCGLSTAACGSRAQHSVFEGVRGLE